jgi:hypothetical protein
MMRRVMAGRLVRAWLVTGVSDALFASCLSVFAYGSTVARLWQGVAAVPFGSGALNGGLLTAAVGLLIHFGVAFAWTAVFLLLAERLPPVRQLIASVPGALAVACVYGPVIWTVMSFLVIPAFTGRAPTITLRWWVQFFGHIPFVAAPIVLSIRRRGWRAHAQTTVPAA